MVIFAPLRGLYDAVLPHNCGKYATMKLPATQVVYAFVLLQVRGFCI